MRIFKLALAICLPVATAAAPAAQYEYPFQNPALPPQQRIGNVLSLLTLQEKIDLMGKSMNIPRLGIHGSGAIDTIPGSSGQFEGLHGLAVGGPNDWGKRAPGVPGQDPYPGTSTIPTTQFPQADGLGETWDSALLEKAAHEEGYEARYIFQSYNRGGLIVRAPNANLERDPRWGRAEESYGEDPYLVGTLAAAFVRGLQGTDPGGDPHTAAHTNSHTWMTVSLVKHFLAYSNEDNRTGSSSNFDARLLHEYYAAPFRMAIEQGGADAMMTAYNAVNGVPMAASPLLRSLAMQRWGFNGMIDIDRGALTFMVTKHKYYPNMAEAAAGAIHAGVNQFLNSYQDAVRAALAQHLIAEADIDRNLAGVLRVMLRLGMLDAPGTGNAYTEIKAGAEPAPWDRASSKQLALQVTRESIVLLKNSGGLLPLDAARVKSIAVVGPLANVVDEDGYGGTPPFAITPLDGIRARAGAGVAVRYAEGGDAAVDLARHSDAAIVVIGNRPFCHKKGYPPPCPAADEGQEGIDRQTITLKTDQEALVRNVLAANPHTIVVLVASFPYAIDWTAAHVPALVQMTHGSEEEGAGLAEVLFGDYNPGGRLTVTWPKSIDQLPPMMDYNIRDGRTYMYFHGDPLFAFGYGLSYTRFAYSRLKTSAPSLSTGETIQVSVQVKNTGARSGSEVAQMYVKYLDSKVERPRLQLVGFDRIDVPAGQARTVTLPLPAKLLRYWDEAKKDWVLEPGKVQLMVGGSSQELRLEKTVQVR